MSFVNVRFPVGVAYGGSGGPRVQMDTMETDSGTPLQAASCTGIPNVYTVSLDLTKSVQVDEIMALFRIVGVGNSLRFKDWMDFKATLSRIGTGDGNTRAFQLKKVYTYGGISISRNISKPVQGTVRIFVSGEEATAGFSIDHDTGYVTFAVAPAAGAAITATFEFDVEVMFQIDSLPVTLVQYNQYTFNSINLVEVVS